MQYTHKGNFLIVFSAAAFGIMPVLAKYAYQDGANPSNFLAFRFFIAALLLTFIMVIKKDTRRLTVRQYLYLAGLGVGGYSMVAGLYFNAVTRIPASLASMLLYTYPAMVMIFAVASGGEKFSLKKFLALGISMTGITLVLGFPARSFETAGIIMAFASAFFYSVYIIVSKKLLDDISPLVTTAYLAWAAAAAFTVNGLLTGQLNFNFGLQAWVAIALIALVSTVAGIVAFLKGLKIIGASQASIISTIEPLVTAALSLLLFEERLSAPQFAGGGLILLATVLLQLKNGEGGMVKDGHSEKGVRKNHGG